MTNHISHEEPRKNRRGRLILLATILVAGTLSVWWLVARADHQMCEDLLTQTRLVAVAVNLENIQALSGTEADIELPVYLRLKEQLAAVRATNPKCRFVYLMGQKTELPATTSTAQAGGTVYFFADSEPVGSEDESPAGQVYEEVSAEYLRVFETKAELVDGPVTDRWGTWISALVPLTDPQTGELVAVLGMDIDARNWKCDVASRAMLPVGLVLLIIIGVVTALIGFGHPNHKKVELKPVQRRLLIPLTTVLLLLIVGFGALLTTQYRSHHRQISKNRLSELVEELEELLEFSMLTVLEDVIVRDEWLRSSLLVGDKERLLADWQPIYEKLRQTRGITYFYFHGHDRVNLLRMHKPEKNGDLIDGSTVLQAERTGKMASGIELGPLGTLTLRLVYPVFDGETLLGYLELGKEIQDALSSIHGKLQVELAVAIRKSTLDRKQWESAMKMLGRDADWNRYGGSVLIYSSLSPLPADCDLFVEKTGYAEHEHGDMGVSAKFGNKQWCVLVSPLQDVSGSEVGNMIILRDVSVEEATFWQLFAVAILAGLLALAGLIAFLHVTLRRTDAGIRAQREELEKIKNRLELAMDAGEHGFWDWNLETDDIYFSPRYYTMLGYEPSELPMVLDTWVELMHPEDRKTIVPKIQKHVKNAEPYEVEFRLKCKDGSYSWIMGKGKSFERDENGKPRRAVGVHEDITERKQAEEALQESEMKFRNLSESTIAGIMLYQNDYWIYANSAAEEITGYTLGELKQMKFWEITAPEYSDLIKERGRAREKGKLAPSGYEFKIITKQGKEKWILLTGNTIEFKSGKAGLITVFDITERKHAEKELRKLSTAVKQSPSVIAITDKNGKLEYVNPKFTEITGYSLEKAIEKNPRILKSGEQPDEMYKELWKIISSGKEWRGEFHNKKKNGEFFWESASISPIFDKKGKIISYVKVGEDITERKQAEEALLRQERLSAIGELASGVAHDFNNALQIIMGGVDMAMVSEEPDELNEYLESIQNSANDAASRVRQLQRFSQKNNTQKESKSININNLAEDVMKQAELIINKYQEKGIHIKVKSDFKAKSNIEGDEGELRSSLFNLIKNSAEAMPKGGRITITTDENDDNVYVSVSDTGMGMDKETQKKVFQPFYSTKGFEPGRGLGMAQVYSAIRDHNGEIYIKESEVGKGTVIEFAIPISKKEVITEKKEVDYVGIANILWVDDEEMIREFGENILKMLGHTADIAANGKEALEFLAKGNKYDLVITDIGMPGMSGWQLAEKIKTKGYTTKIAVLTGWGTDISQEDKEKYNVDYVLGKPIELEDLKALIAEVLQIKNAS